MKKYVLFFIVVLLLVTYSISFATESVDFDYLPISGEENSGEDDSTVLINDDKDYDDLYEDDSSASQEQLKEEFEKQQKELFKYVSGEKGTEFVITEVLSDIKSQYSADYYYCYLINYQEAKIRIDGSGEIPAVIVLSYDLTDNKSLKPLKVGDTAYGYVENISKNSSTYTMVDHDFKEDSVAFVSIMNQDRSLGMILLTAFTLLLLALYAGRRGAKLLIPAFVLIDLLFIVLVPEIELAKSILIYSALTGLELIILISVLKDGWSKKSVVSIISSMLVVVLIASLGYVFGNANSLTGKGILSEENYDLLSNVYYIDAVFKSTVGTFNIYLAMIIIITSVVSASICSRMTDICEKYAGTQGMVNGIIEESKSIVADYPLIIVTLFFVLYMPSYMVLEYNHTAFVNVINSESLVTYLALTLLTVIGALICSPITAITSHILMGDVEIKRLEE